MPSRLTNSLCLIFSRIFVSNLCATTLLNSMQLIDEYVIGIYWDGLIGVLHLGIRFVKTCLKIDGAINVNKYVLNRTHKLSRPIFLISYLIISIYIYTS